MLKLWHVKVEYLWNKSQWNNRNNIKMERLCLCKPQALITHTQICMQSTQQLDS